MKKENVLSVVRSVVRAVGPSLGCLLVMGGVAFAQGGPFSAAAQGASAETILAVKYAAGAVFAGCGLMLMFDHEHGIGKKLTGLISGGVVALFAQPIVSWIQSL